MAYKGIIAPEKLPSSQRAAYFHGLRAHYQVMCWSMLDEEFNFNVCEWGCRKTNNLLVPIMTDKPVAPESLTKVIRCRCKKSTKNPCGTKTCTCRKYGMACVSSCGECHGIECNNTEEVSIITLRTEEPIPLDVIEHLISERNEPSQLYTNKALN